jgi:hypothetical protein
MSRPDYVNPIEWELALSMARSICADEYRKGGTPKDALRTNGVQQTLSHPNWQCAIDIIAYSNCASGSSKTAKAA